MVLEKNQAELSYEFGIDIFNKQLVWINGPFVAANHDLVTNSRAEGGLKSITIPNGKRVRCW